LHGNTPMTTVRQRLRKHLSPLAADTVTTLNLPPVRMGLLTKLNLLTVGLIALTAVAVTAFFAWQEWRDVQQQIRAQGRVVLTMLSDLSAPGLAAQDKAQIERTLSSLASDGDIAYVAVNDASGRPFAERRFSEKLQGPLPALAADAGRLDRLAVDGAGARLGVAPQSDAESLAQQALDPFPGAIPPPLPEVVEGRLPRRPVRGQQAPGAARAQQVQESVHDGAHAVASRPPGGARAAGAVAPASATRRRRDW